MGKLINMTAYVINSTQQSPSLQVVINEDEIVRAIPATTLQKQSYPSASANINTWVIANERVENANLQVGYLIGEQPGTLISGSN
jgi:hypothetical protein